MNYLMISRYGGAGSCLELPALCLNPELPSDFGPGRQQSITLCLWSAWHKQGLSSFLSCTPLPVKHGMWSQEVTNLFWSGQAVTDICAGSGQPGAPTDCSFWTPTISADSESHQSATVLEAHQKLLLGAAGTGTRNCVTVLRKVCLASWEAVAPFPCMVIWDGHKKGTIYHFSFEQERLL